MSYDVINVILNKKSSSYCYSLGSNCPPTFSFYETLFVKTKKNTKLVLPDAIVIFEDDTAGELLLWDFDHSVTAVMSEDGSLKVRPDLMHWVDPINKARLRSLTGRPEVSVKALWRASKQRVLKK